MSEDFPDSVKGVMVFERVPDFHVDVDDYVYSPPYWANPRNRSRPRLSNNKKRCVSAKAMARKKKGGK